MFIVSKPFFKQVNIVRSVGRFIACIALPMMMWLPAHATLISIDFESDSLGAIGNGFSSVDAPGVLFTDTVGADLFLLTGTEADGQSLAVFGDFDSSGLLIEFGTNLDFLELAFGNDDPLTTNYGDLATLRLYLGTSLVDDVTLLLNRDDLMNQWISYGSVGGAILFDSAIFAFTDPFGSFNTGGGTGANVGSTEVVDNIRFNTVTSIPEPSTLGLLLSGLLLMLAVRQR